MVVAQPTRVRHQTTVHRHSHATKENVAFRSVPMDLQFYSDVIISTTAKRQKSACTEGAVNGTKQNTRRNLTYLRQGNY